MLSQTLNRSTKHSLPHFAKKDDTPKKASWKRFKVVIVLQVRLRIWNKTWRDKRDVKSIWILTKFWLKTTFWYQQHWVVGGAKSNFSCSCFFNFKQIISRCLKYNKTLFSASSYVTLIPLQIVCVYTARHRAENRVEKSLTHWNFTRRWIQRKQGEPLTRLSSSI